MKRMNYVHLTLTLLVLSIGVANAQQNTDYVDLGLPSGALWATCNVGASYAWESGDYYAWGETRPNSCYSWSTYKYANGDDDRLTKYCNQMSKGNFFHTDELTELEPSDDVAAIKMGSKWHIPSEQEWQELLDNTDRKIVANYKGSGVRGCLVTSKKYPNRHIFLPAAGYYDGSKLISGTDYPYKGMYWTSTIHLPNCQYAKLWWFYSSFESLNIYYDNRAMGLTIRAVR